MFSFVRSLSPFSSKGRKQSGSGDSGGKNDDKKERETSGSVDESVDTRSRNTTMKSKTSFSSFTSDRKRGESKTKSSALTTASSASASSGRPSQAKSRNKSILKTNSGYQANPPSPSTSQASLRIIADYDDDDGPFSPTPNNKEGGFSFSFSYSRIRRYLAPSPSLSNRDEASIILYSDETIIEKQGYFDKQGLSVVNSWQTRYFVLTNIGIFWFLSDADFVVKRGPQGMILYNNIVIPLNIVTGSGDSIPIKDKELPLCFQVLIEKKPARKVPPSMYNIVKRKHVISIDSDVADVKRTFLFSFGSNGECDEWLNAITKAYNNFTRRTHAKSVSSPPGTPLIPRTKPSDSIDEVVGGFSLSAVPTSPRGGRTIEDIVGVLEKDTMRLRRGFVLRKCLLQWKILLLMKKIKLVQMQQISAHETKSHEANRIDKHDNEKKQKDSEKKKQFERTGSLIMNDDSDIPAKDFLSATDTTSSTPETTSISGTIKGIPPRNDSLIFTGDDSGQLAKDFITNKPNEITSKRPSAVPIVENLRNHLQKSGSLIFTGNSSGDQEKDFLAVTGEKLNTNNNNNVYETNNLQNENANRKDSIPRSSLIITGDGGEDAAKDFLSVGYTFNSSNVSNT